MRQDQQSLRALKSTRAKDLLTRKCKKMGVQINFIKQLGLTKVTPDLKIYKFESVVDIQRHVLTTTTATATAHVAVADVKEKVKLLHHCN